MKDTEYVLKILYGQTYVKDLVKMHSLALALREVKLLSPKA